MLPAVILFAIVVDIVKMFGKIQSMKLCFISSNFFVDMTALACVRFERLEQSDATATMLFKTGASETVRGAAAQGLHQLLERAEENESSNAQPPVAAVQIEAKKALSVSAPRTVAASSFLGRKKAWFYRKDQSGRDYILAFVNAKGSSSLRTFDAQSGINKGKRYLSGDYQKNFADLLNGATELTVYNQPNLERDCKDRLPEDVLAHLRDQIDGGVQ